MRRGPSLPGFLFGAAWIVVALVLFATMVSGYARFFGVTGTLFAISVLPLSAPAYPFIVWYHVGGFPWLWAVGLLLAIGMGRVLLGE
ncbi:MAG: hypothetical protein HYT86_02370 [candidate division NC10 bacterium]|nr:hypothetical protein [candidate division NC10 bacterium]